MADTPPSPPEVPPSDRELVELLRASRDKLKAVFDTMSDPVFSLTPELTVESVNLALSRMLQRHPRELVGRHYRDVLRALWPDEHIHQAVAEGISRADRTRALQRLVLVTPSRPDERYWEVSVSPVRDPAGAVALLVVQFKDITEFKRMEDTIVRYSRNLEEMVDERTKELVEARDQLRAEKERLEQAYERLKDLEQLRHDLTAMVVHDLKGPLAEVLGNLDLIAYEPLSETQREYLGLAELGAEDLLRMIMNLLDIDRMEEGRIELRTEPVDFAAAAERVSRKFQTVIGLKELELVIDDQSKQPLLVDQGLFDRVLQNLLTNAIGHTDEGGAITLAAREEADEVVIRVTDNGEGIDPQHQGRIFEKFSQAHGGRGPRTSTGLGLAFCKLAVQAHGGRIWFESRLGEGTTFFVALPRRAADRAPRAVTPAEAGP